MMLAAVIFLRVFIGLVGGRTCTKYRRLLGLYLPWSVSLGTGRSAGWRLSAIHFDLEDAPAVEPQATEARSILLEVLWGLPPHEPKHAQAVFSGIVGHANNSPVARASPAAMLQALRQRFAQSEKFRELRAHPRFDAYLHAKATELFAEKRVTKKKGGPNSLR